ncbi:MAG: penicillin acylase family protein [Candidatus Heimdallarchaeota archaeon]|nr:MAG: penicillin acylase family protein [Candidatus Heimdallarchaeota archaeon]
MSLPRDLYKQGALLTISIGGVLLLVLILSTPIMGMFALGPIVSPGGIFGASKGSDYVSDTITLEGIDNTVTIIRDNWGIPHIYAETHKDAAFALGYCHATDRMFQMEMIARTGMGRTAEILGNSSLEDDIFYQTIGIEKTAQEMLDTFKNDNTLDEMLNILDSYCEGANYEINHRTNTKTLPIEFQLLGFKPSPWTPLKTFVYNLLMGLSGTYSTYDLQATILRDKLFNGNLTAMDEIFPLNQSYYQVPVIPKYGNYSLPSNEMKMNLEPIHSTDDDIEARVSAINKILNRIPDSVRFLKESGVGSNNWAVNGSKTVTGMPMLANDMHLEITLPHIWYEAHLVVSKPKMNIYGYTLTGTPIVIVGFNTHVAWGITYVSSDALDWYEYIWDDSSSQYWSGSENKWKSPEERIITIPVKGLNNHTETIRYTEDGVVMAEEMGRKLIAMRWITTESPTYEIKAMYGVNTATNWKTFNESMQWFSSPTINVVFADTEGNIALRPTGRIIKRNFTQAYQGRFIQNGSDSNLDKDWDYIPFNELPYDLNPPQNYLASANQKSTGPDYPYYISSTQDPGYRARCINRFLNEAQPGTIDVDFMKKLQCGDWGIFDISAEAFTPYFLDAFDQSGETLSDTATIALAKLKTWNNSDDRYLMKKELVGPTIFDATLSRFREFVWQDDYDEAEIDVTKPQDNTLEFLVRNFPESKWFDNVTTPLVEKRDDIIVKGFLKAIEDLEEILGSDVSEWKWGEYHRMHFNHLGGIPAFSAGNYPHDGSSYTPLLAGGRAPRVGPSERMVVDFNNISNSWSVIPAGVSGNPSNPHYADQALNLWMEGQYHLMLIEYNSVEQFPIANREAKVILKPK